ncbi:MAG: lysophospholipid acyltransferase family protein [Mailhella sp.]|nr:lysophospholipid acyltransferase family protein [Mailhella sp.]
MTAGQKIRLRILKGIGSFIRRFGFSGVERMGSFMGRLFWRLLPSRRKLAIDNIMTHLGKSREDAERIAFESFTHNMRSFLEIVLTKDFGLDAPNLRFDPPELFEELKNCQRPIVAATAHFGSWELLASLLGQIYEAPRPRMVVVRGYPDPAVQEFIASCREATGAEMVGHRQAAMGVIRALHKNGIAAFLVDHNAMRREAIFIPFLGEEAAVNAGPALLAVRGKALVWPVVLTREGKDYVFRLQKPLDTEELTGTREENILETARFYTQAIEKFIHEAPEQWFWMHERWKTKFRDDKKFRNRDC